MKSAPASSSDLGLSIGDPVVACSSTMRTDAKQALLMAALQAFSETGLEATSTRRIAQLSGQNIASISYHFRSKEGLYTALAQAMVRRMRGMLDPVLDDAHLILEQPVIQKANALHLLLRLVRGLSLALTTQETMAMSRIIMREQIEPTAAFDVIYDTGIGPIHRALTGLLAAAVGADARAPEMIMHSHALLGTVLSFRVAHETILRRMQWKCIGPEQSQQIAEVAAQHSLALVLTLRSTLRESKRPSRLEVQSNSKPSHSPPRSASPRATQPRLRKKKAIP